MPPRSAERVRQLMSMVGLDPRFLRRYPHSFSGGQRQRIGIARALALQPGTDPVRRAGIRARRFRSGADPQSLEGSEGRNSGLTYLFVSHNLAVVDYIADRIAVMCKGRLVELAECRTLIDDPIHPYTRALLAAVPEPSLDHPLDFSALSESRASDPAAWPEPFRVDGDTYPKLVEMRPGHLVCAPGLTADSPAQEAV